MPKNQNKQKQSRAKNISKNILFYIMYFEHL